MSILIIGILIGILLPPIAKINEATRRVMPLEHEADPIGISMYAMDNFQFSRARSMLHGGGSGRAASTMTLRVDESGGNPQAAAHRL